LCLTVIRLDVAERVCLFVLCSLDDCDERLLRVAKSSSV
jgi:hypothetical protein